MKMAGRTALGVTILFLLLAGVAPPGAMDKEALMDPEALVEKAPDTFSVKFATTKGDFVVDVTREWAPLGADRFYNLVKNGFFEEVRFFRAMEGFMVQFGVNGDPELSRVWQTATIKDDPVIQSNAAGYMTYATSGPNSRTTQLFINLGDNAGLDPKGFAPFGRVVEGMETVGQLYSGYGDEPSRGGRGPEQGKIQAEGNAYLEKDFPQLDYVKTATLVP